MSSSTRTDRFAFNVMVYVLLIGGGIIFCWPLAWMAGTSVKADKELFTQTLHIFPQTPLAIVHSPYVDERSFDDLKVTRDDLLTALENYVGTLKNAWPDDLDHAAMTTQVARGLYQRLQNLLPEDTWSMSDKDLAAAAIKQVNPEMGSTVVKQISRGLLLGQLRARSYDIQEDQLMSSKDAATAWTVEGDVKTSLKPVTVDNQQYAQVNYDFSTGDSLKLSKTFQTSFPINRLYRLQLFLRPDDGWHPLSIFVEKEGNLYESVRSTPMQNSEWTVLTWQEEGPDDKTNKIRNWIHLEKIASGPAYESDPHKIKVTIELGSVNVLQAWWYKIARNYLLVFDNMPFWHYTATSIFVVVLNLLGTVFSCSVVAYSFARMRWPGRNVSYAVMLSTMLIPPPVTMIPTFLIMRWLGWYNTLYPLWITSFFASAFFVFLLHQFFKGIPTDLEDAAKIDGCGPIRIYWNIMLPLIKPALATVAIFTFMGVWSDFMTPLIYVSDQRLYPLSLGLYALDVQAGGSSSMMMAGSLLMLLPVILIFFFMQRYFIEGITMTGLKS